MFVFVFCFVLGKLFFAFQEIVRLRRDLLKTFSFRGIYSARIEPSRQDSNLDHGSNFNYNTRQCKDSWRPDERNFNGNTQRSRITLARRIVFYKRRRELITYIETTHFKKSLKGSARFRNKLMKRLLCLELALHSEKRYCPKSCLIESGQLVIHQNNRNSGLS